MRATSFWTIKVEYVVAGTRFSKAFVENNFRRIYWSFPDVLIKLYIKSCWVVWTWTFAGNVIVDRRKYILMHKNMLCKKCSSTSRRNCAWSRLSSVGIISLNLIQIFQSANFHPTHSYMWGVLIMKIKYCVSNWHFFVLLHECLATVKVRCYDTALFGFSVTEHASWNLVKCQYFTENRWQRFEQGMCPLTKRLMTSRIFLSI